ncbi:MAG: AIR synthase family protein [Eubacteriales bacterium]|nr:AIR synthase family protein [Eubacteriales bacterium]MDY3332179.1 AIR synthase family protein [Gallibacter sp.]
MGFHNVPLGIGKVENDLLKKIVFDKITYRHEDVKVRSKIGEDCAVVGFGDYDCVISSDPITATTSEIGSLAIHITCNDIASNGVRPIAIMVVALLPSGTTTEDIETIMDDAGKAASEIGVEIVGGHTEITDAINRPILITTAIGKKLNDAHLALEISEGDSIILTKKAGLEGTAIIVMDKEAELQDILDESEIDMAKSFMQHISVVKEGVIAGEIGVAAMHDVTEGGVFGGIWELCESAEKGALIDVSKIAIDDTTLKIAEKFDINPYKLISSGSMLIISPKDKTEDIVNAINSQDIDACVIGEIKDKMYGIKYLDEQNEVKDIQPPSSDEIYRVLS